MSEASSGRGQGVHEGPDRAVALTVRRAGLPFHRGPDWSRLGDERERARKAVAARVHDAIDRIGRVAPELAAHLHSAVRTGTWCVYAPTDPVRWTL